MKGTGCFFSGDNGLLKVRLNKEDYFNKSLINPDGTAGNLGIIGFVGPKKIESYFCRNCRREYDEFLETPPEVEVVISRDDIIGKPFAQEIVRCGECGTPVYISAISKNIDKIDPKYIKLDKTGDYRKPTKGEIEEQLVLALIEASEGNGRSLSIVAPFYENFNQASLWAEKIGYEIPEGSEEVLKRMWMNSYLKRFEKDLPDFLESIKDLSGGFNDIVDGTTGMSNFYLSGLADKLEILYEALKHIEIDDEGMKKYINEIRQKHALMRHKRISRLNDERRRIDESISEELEEQKKILEELRN